MKTVILISFLSVITIFAFSQEIISDSTNHNFTGLYDISKAEIIEPNDILNKYLEIEVYRLNEKKNETEIIKIGPANADLVKFFSENNGSSVLINDLSGINFAAIKALQKTSQEMEHGTMQFEELQEIVNRQFADMTEMQNNLLQLMGEIEELKQKNIDLANDLENFKMEINTKE